MNLKTVTMTGADDSIYAGELRQISIEYPFVEWGILVSERQMGSPRFPSMGWLRSLTSQAAEAKMNLSLHVCGGWVRELLIGNLFIPESLINGQTYERIQLNFHADQTPCKPHEFSCALRSLGKRQFIFQIDGAKGNEHLDAIYSENFGHNIDAVPLFDISGGAGILPDKWPKPEYMATDVDYIEHGYAGGLGPDNLSEQLPLIAEASDGAPIWIDMETRVRSTDDRVFDLEKVRRCLAICKPFIA